MDQGWRSGPRHRVTVPRTPECWRCTETRRKLRPVGLVVEGKHIGTVLLCAPCIEERRPLNPDPLTVAA